MVNSIVWEVKVTRRPRGAERPDVHTFSGVLDDCGTWVKPQQAAKAITKGVFELLDKIPQNESNCDDIEFELKMRYRDDESP